MRASSVVLSRPVQESGRLLLRRLTPHDAPALHRCTGDAAVMRHWHPGPDADIVATASRIAEIDAHWQRHGFGDWAVLMRDSGELIGFAGLHHVAGMTEVNVGYALVLTHRRRGLGTELCTLLLEHGFTVLDLPEIVAVIDPRNSASVALATHCGLTFRRELIWQGQSRVLHAMTRAEFEAGRDPGASAPDE
jgi:[ribosomal protein S5]-alanine N-acetyltransferase